MADQNTPDTTNTSNEAIPPTSQELSAMTQDELMDLAKNLPPITRSAIPTLTGWPASGGVWVLNPTRAQLDEVDRLPIMTDMEEYCRALERIGATFYSDPRQCEEVRGLMEDGVDLQFRQAPPERQNQ